MTRRNLHIYIDTNAKWLHLGVFHLVLLHAPLALIYVNLDLGFDPLPETLLQPSAILLCIHHLILLPPPLMALEPYYSLRHHLRVAPTARGMATIRHLQESVHETWALAVAAKPSRLFQRS